MSHSTSNSRGSARASSSTQHPFTSTGRRSATATTMSGQARYAAEYSPFGQPVNGPFWDLTLLDRLQAPLTHFHE